MLAAWLLATGFLIKSYVYDSEKGLTQVSNFWLAHLLFNINFSTHR